MKRLLLTGLLFLGVGQVASFAQTDDIYFNSADIEQQKKEDKKRAAEEARIRAAEEENQYSSYGQNGSESGDYQTYNKSYDSDGYSEYNGDDYYYSSRIRRFNYPFYNMGYYSAFHNPYWYDPFWSDPYWGWSPWTRPGFSITMGYGPYWNSYGGWYSWYGYGAFNSFWNYPYYAYPYGSYYSGFWNGYYAGLYNNNNNYGGGRTVTYGPRNSTNVLNNTRDRSSLGMKPGAVNTNPRAGFRTTPAANTAQPVRNTADNGRVVSEDRPAGRRAVDARSAEANEEMTNSRGGVATDRAMDDNRPVRRRFYQSEAQPSQDRQAGSMTEGGTRYQQPRQEARPSYPSPRQQQQTQPQREPRYQQQRAEPRYETPRAQPRYEAPRSQPSYQSPRMSSPAPSRGGGSFNSSGRGGSRR